MTVGISTYLANKWLESGFKNTAYTPPTTVYMKMHTGDPGAAGTSNASAQTTRQAVGYAAAASGSIAANTTPDNTLNASETVSHVSFWDHPTAGNFLASSAATVAKGGVSGDIIRLASNTFSITPLAAT